MFADVPPALPETVSRFNGVYLVTPDWDDTDRLLEVTAAALRGGVSLLQYRHKEASPALRLKQARGLRDLCGQEGVPFVVNDHLDLCRAVAADGVHLGGTDMTIAAARAELGPDRIIGASCYGDMALALGAAAAGASYIAFGGFYPSRVKKYSFTTALTVPAQARAATGLPVVAIGGIGPDNAWPLIETGVDMVAAISSVYGASQPEQEVRALRALFERRAAMTGKTIEAEQS